MASLLRTCLLLALVAMMAKGQGTPWDASDTHDDAASRMVEKLISPPVPSFPCADPFVDTMDLSAFDPLPHTTNFPGGLSVTYTSTLPADYNSFGPGFITFVQDPSIEGALGGRITVTFNEPVCGVQFGMAINVFGGPFTIPVQVFGNGAMLLNSQVLTLNTIVSFAEGLFSYMDPGCRIQSLVINTSPAVAQTGAATRFALDNLKICRFNPCAASGCQIRFQGASAGQLVCLFDTPPDMPIQVCPGQPGVVDRLFLGSRPINVCNVNGVNGQRRYQVYNTATGMFVEPTVFGLGPTLFKSVTVNGYASASHETFQSQDQPGLQAATGPSGKIFIRTYCSQLQIGSTNINNFVPSNCFCYAFRP